MLKAIDVGSTEPIDCDRRRDLQGWQGGILPNGSGIAEVRPDFLRATKKREG